MALDVRVFQHPEPSERDEIIALCELAFDERLGQYFDDIGAGTHVCGRMEGRLASHTMWVERRLETDRGERWRTAYVELVATHPEFHGRGYGTRLMQELQERVQAFDIAALAPDETTLYERLGWEWWRGPLYVRKDSRWVASDESERVMILRLPGTPDDIDLDAGLSVEWRPGPEVW